MKMEKTGGQQMTVDEMGDGGWQYTDITAIAATDGKKKQENGRNLKAVKRGFNRWRGKRKRVVGSRMILVSRRRRRRVRFGGKRNLA